MGERKALDVQARLEYARTAVAVLRAPQIMDTRIPLSPVRQGDRPHGT